MGLHQTSRGLEHHGALVVLLSQGTSCGAALHAAHVWMVHAGAHAGSLCKERAARSTSIVQAYRKLSLKLHPDRNSAADATAVFQRVTDARALLLDPQARAAYENVQRYAP